MKELVKGKSVAGVISAFALSFIVVPSVYWICNKLGIHLPGWQFQEILDYVANGGAVVAAFAFVAGITLPWWIAGAITVMGGVAA